MFRSFFVILILFFLQSSADEWKLVKSVSLKKDQLENIVVKSGSLQKLFEFRWTLYKNGSLVVLRSYDDFVAQNMLNLKHKNRSFKEELLSKGMYHKEVPYLLVTFKSFDFKKNKALFDIYLSDDDEKVILQFIGESK